MHFKLKNKLLYSYRIIANSANSIKLFLIYKFNVYSTFEKSSIQFLILNS